MTVVFLCWDDMKRNDGPSFVRKHEAETTSSTMFMQRVTYPYIPPTTVSSGGSNCRLLFPVQKVLATIGSTPSLSAPLLNMSEDLQYVPHGGGFTGLQPLTSAGLRAHRKGSFYRLCISSFLHLFWNADAALGRPIRTYLIIV